MASRRTLIALMPVAVLAGVAGCRRAGTASGAANGQPGFAAGSAIFETYPASDRTTPQAVKGELLDGSPFDLATLRGSVVVLNFWASWCAPCRVETKHLVDTYAATKDLGVAFVGVDVRDERDKARAFAEDFHVTYPSLFDPAGRVALSFSQVPPSTIPATVILDRQGRVAAVFRKAIQQEELEQIVRQVATEVAAESEPAHG